MISTLGLVRGSSKKQRVAKKNLKANKKTAKELAKANQLTEKQLELEQDSQQDQLSESSTDYAELEKLAELKDKGIITESEFEEKKRDILNLS